MIVRASGVLAVCAVLAVIVGTLGSCALEDRTVHVLSSGGFASAYDTLAPRFERMTGFRLRSDYGPSTGSEPHSIPRRLGRGEPADLVILSRQALNALALRGDVVPDSRTDLADARIGMVVRKGAPGPDISTAQKFVNTVLEAPSIGYSAGASGIYLSEKLFPRLGIWKRLEPKSQRVVGELVARAVARGDLAIGFQQISELLSVPGVKYVGPIPDDYQRVTTFSAGLTSHARNLVGARGLLAFLASEDAAETIAEAGLEPRAKVRAAAAD